MRYFALTFMLASLCTGPVAMAEPEPTPLPASGETAALKNFPRYASLKKGEVNVRSGPGNQYPILWVYNRTGYPVQLLTRYDNYFKLRDVEGEEGWVYIGMVTGRQTALVSGQTPAPLYRRNDATSNLVAKLAPGVVVEFEDPPCATTLCEVTVEGLSGYVPKASLTMVD